MPGLADFFTQLKRRYQIDHRDLQTIEGERQLIAEAFIRLTLIQNEEQRDKERRLREGRRDEAGAPDANDRTKREFRDERLSSWEDLYTPKTPIDLKAIFDPDPKAPAVNSNRLLVVGRAGIGKSTLCQYIAYQWATDHLFADKFEAVFWIPLRRLDPARYPEARQYRVVEILNAECFNGQLLPEDLDQLQLHIQENPHRFLFLLDGYDEVLPEVRRSSLQTAFEQLIAQPCSLISSRPHDTAGLHGIDRCLELMGFMPEDIEAYIQGFFANPRQRLAPEVAQAKAKALLDYLKRQPDIWGIAHIPLQLAMICPLHEEIIGEASLTVSALYHRLVKNLFKKMLLREGHPRKKCTSAYIRKRTELTQACLTQLALRTMLENQIVLPETAIDDAIQIVMPTTDADVQAVQQERLQQQCGFLRKVGDRPEYYFIHLTFQEYFAAAGIARVLKQVGISGSESYEQMRRIILEHRYNPRFQLVWRYVAGHLADDVRALKRFFDILMTEPRDLLGAYERHLLVHCLAESGEPEGLRLKRDQVLQPLIAALQDMEGRVRISAANALGKVGSAATPGVVEGLLGALTPAIEERLFAGRQQQDFWMTCDSIFASILALGNLSTIAATPVVLKRLLDAGTALGDDGVAVVAMVFNKLSAVTPTIVKGLFDALRGKDERIRYTAAYALGKMGVSNPAIVDGLLYAEQDENGEVSGPAAYALSLSEGSAWELEYEEGERTPTNLAFVDKWLSNLLCEGALERKNAADTLGSISAAVVVANPAVMERLLAVLRNENDYHSQRDAANVLGKIGTFAATPTIFFDLLPVETTDVETLYTTVAIVLAYRFTRQNTAFFYDPATQTLCCWEKGTLQSFALPLRNRNFLISEIQKAWVEHIHLPITALPPPAETPLHEAATSGHLLQVHELLRASHSDLDNQNNERGFTSLMCAAQAGHAEIAQTLIEAGANIAAVSLPGRGDFDTAISLAMSHPPSEDTRWVLLMMLLRRRQRVSLETLQSWLDKLACEYQGNADGEQTDQDLINTQVARWIAKADLGTTWHDERWRYLAHLDSIAGDIRVGRGDPEPLEGMFPREFLSLRIRLYAELILRIERGLLAEAELPQNKLKILSLLKAECLLMLETLNNLRDVETIHAATDIAHPDAAVLTRAQDERRRLFHVAVLNIVEKLATLGDGETYECATGFAPSSMLSQDGHSMYLLVTRQSDQWIVQLNNLGDGRSPHPIREGKVLPYWIGSFSQENLKNPIFIDYLIHVLQARFMQKTPALHGLYSTRFNRGARPDVETRWSANSPQTVGNCVVRNHNVGLECRLVLRHGDVQGRALYHWLLQQERQLIVRYYPKDPAPGRAPAVAIPARQRDRALDTNYPSAASPVSLAAVASQRGVFAAPAVVLPAPATITHEQLMQRFAEALQVDYQEIYIGTTAEQTLVRMAGIDRDQTGAMFRRHDERITYFKLKLNDDELSRFTAHYQSTFPGSIQQVHVRSGEWVRVDFNTQLLADVVVPALNVFSRSSACVAST